MNEVILIIFQLIVLILSVMVHEVMHGYAAYFLGDMTAKNANRLNFNPLNHLDPFGSIILPLLLYISTAGTFVIGWAKPVPYNPLNLKNPKSGAGIIAIAGPLSNFAIAILAALLLKLNLVLGGLVQPIFLQIVIILNLSLMVFNLVPIPPLDGSKVLFALLPARYSRIQYALERYGLWILLIFIFFGFSLIIPVIGALYNLIA
jgi:Zn-dependent protease